MERLVKEAIKDIVDASIFYRNYYDQYHDETTVEAQPISFNMDVAIMILETYKILNENHTEESKGS
jgi:hypothetical protein